MINLVLSIVPLLIVLLAVRVPIRASILFLPIPVLLLLFFSLGFGLLLSLVAMYFPDVAEMYNVALRGWMYLTPIIYPESLLRNAGLDWLLFINPLYHLIKIFRTPINNGQIPTIEELWPAALVSGMMLIIGWLIFTKRSDEFAYRV
jgi:ABC-type polysaccharide/polyol phosphate export permease